jgi:hypothetical protein
MCSQDRPIRSMAPGAKFDEHVGVTDQLLHNILALSGFGVDRQRPLLLFSMVKYRASTSGMSRSW